MKTLEHAPASDIKSSLERIPGVSKVQKVEINTAYWEWAKDNISPENYSIIQSNYESLNVYKFTYLSEGLSIIGFVWAPKELKGQLPLVIWNRGGTREYGSNGENLGVIYSKLPCELAKTGNIVVASEYRGGLDSEGNDEWGGADLNDVIQLKKIADQLPMRKAGKVVVVGASRGGMMSYLLASKEPWVKAVISLAGVADLNAEGSYSRMYEEYKSCFGGGEEEMKKRSAVNFYPLIPKGLPILLLHGTADDRVSVDQSRRLNELLKESGHQVQYYELPDAGHFFYSPGGSHREETLGIIREFLKTQQS